MRGNYSVKGRFRKETEEDGEKSLQDLKLLGTLIPVVQRIHAFVGEFSGACGSLHSKLPTRL